MGTHYYGASYGGYESNGGYADASGTTALPGVSAVYVANRHLPKTYELLDGAAPALPDHAVLGFYRQENWHCFGAASGGWCARDLVSSEYDKQAGAGWQLASEHARNASTSELGVGLHYIKNSGQEQYPLTKECKDSTIL